MTGQVGDGISWDETLPAVPWFFTVAFSVKDSSSSKLPALWLGR